ncbi:MAG TPA: TldD/PmbA family protein [Candidatus Hydrothermia bacterium]|nr:TldD/PmbA family protein [Candidatus Hydrothermia bacterium]MDD5573333.1 TldD/PmbA family protein [Candidatus Hydrothermia bacterium]HOK22741.1 TldD/PmbA family protein [Candidatus Hydrothermia bacterium]HOL23450.1 TldD/PmbA family protein [Candidatus Hydrothermia bacterium]HPO78366.1 TldD/PmbA family protein [Candidatus Hydrothermia bacterium]
MERIVSEAKKKELNYEVFFTKEETKSLNFEQSELKDISHKIIEGIGVRLIHNGRMGASSSNNVSNLEVLDFALNSARFGKEVQFTFPELPLHSESFGDSKSELEFEKLYPVINEIVRYLENKYQGKVDLSLTQMKLYQKLTNYRCENYIERNTTFFDFGLSLFSVTSSGFLITYSWSWKKSGLTSDDLWNITRKMEQTLVNYDKIAKITSGRYKVIFSPYALLSTLGITISSGVNGFNLARRMSPLLSKLNEKILNEKINITDDPNLDTPSKRGFDDEGLRTAKRSIIENGTLKDYILNLDSAAELKMNPTGNGIRYSFSSLPLPGFHNFAVQEGERSLKDIIRGMDNAILFLIPIGEGQSNIIMGDYSLNVGLGYYVENGEIVGRVKDTMISGNVYTDFQEVLEISKDTELLMSRGYNTFFNLPFIIVDNVSVTTK